MNYKNEADELRALAKILENGYVFRGLKPVNWCFDCGSALAEAEVEYKDKVDPAVDVGFAFAEHDKLAQAFAVDSARLQSQPGHLVIWTTTPWTIPANQALNAHPEIDYALVETDKGWLILAKDRVSACLEIYGLTGTITATCLGAALSGIAFHHPLYQADAGYDRLSPIFPAEYVTLETGTGIVHCAPAYGEEDFKSCRANGIKDSEILTPVQGDGVYAATLPLFGGLKIWDANPKIVEALQAAGSLFKVKKDEHSYMHCWRHKTPIIYRATNQWFAGMDVKPSNGSSTLRENALAAVEATQFYPGWGKQRLHNMIANRPDWTLSRQRQWGVPMAFFIHKETGALHPRSVELLELIAQHVEQEGIEAWQRLNIKELLGNEADQYVKNKDTLDVWFDSGTTHWHVMRGSHPELDTPAHQADLYLEGSDQHRGWFHSSLLTSCMMNGHAPYKGLLTHGFTVDGQGRKMSKSVGNVIAPQQVSDKMGAEIIRLWVASTDYSGELSISDEILKRVVETYRRIRNTLKFLLANTADFDPKTHALPVSEWLEIDRYALALTATLQQDTLAAYEKYEFHPVVARIQTFCSEDLGGFYLDVLKDRLYTSAVNSPARRSAQNALYHITQALLRLMAPWLSFTAEEAWQLLVPGSKTIFVETYYEFPSIAESAELQSKWNALREIRAEVTKQLEAVRTTGAIGSSLQAEIEIKASGAKFALLQGLQDDLRFILITSAAKVTEVVSAADEAVIVTPSSHAKCERCWHYRADVGSNADHPHLCGRCDSNLHGSGEVRGFA